MFTCTHILGIALLEVTSTIEEKILSSETTVVFMLKDLKKIYQEKILHLGRTEEFAKNVNVTRLKKKILEQVEGLCERKSSKYILLALDGSIGKAMFEASLPSYQDEEIAICKAAKTIRKYLFQDNVEFNADLSEEKQRSSVPKHLLHLIGLILEGITVYDKISKKTEEIALNLSQLIRFNAVKAKRESATTIRHSRINEPPFPVMLGLRVHVHTRNKKVVEKLASDGLSIPYARVLQIEEAIAKQLCKKYADEDYVSPPSLKGN